jgi:hypothetical protein
MKASEKKYCVKGYLVVKGVRKPFEFLVWAKSNRSACSKASKFYGKLKAVTEVIVDTVEA